MRRTLLAVSIAFVLNGCSDPIPSLQDGPKFKILVFSKTAGFRHDSIPDGIAMIQPVGSENHFAVDASEDSSLFNDANLASYGAVIFLNTTGDILDNNQKAAFQRYIEMGGGFVGIHSASDTLLAMVRRSGGHGSYLRHHRV
jgi:cytochrome c